MNKTFVAVLIHVLEEQDHLKNCVHLWIHAVVVRNPISGN